jgi:hypothetical protein
MGMLARSVATALMTVAFFASPASAASHAAKSPHGVVYKQAGTRSSTTKPFVAPREWTIAWSFDCAKSPFSEGSFTVAVHPVSGNRVRAAEGPKVDAIGPNGSGQQTYHGAGPKTLVILAQCPWRLKVLRGAA